VLGHVFVLGGLFLCWGPRFRASGNFFWCVGGEHSQVAGALQCGASRVYAIEASQMARFAEELKKANPGMVCVLCGCIACVLDDDGILGTPEQALRSRVVNSRVA
jgi:hypothetical protein